MILLVSLFGDIYTNNSRISNIFHYTSNLTINVLTLIMEVKDIKNV